MNKSKKIGELNSLLKEAYFNIKEKKFEDAIRLYNRIHDAFSTLDVKEKTEKLKKDLEVLYKELNLYLSINQAYILAQKGNLQGLKHEISEIHDIVYDLKSENEESIKPLLDYTKKHYQFFLEVYSYNFNIRDFNDKCEQIYFYLDENQLSEATKNFSELVVVYKKLLDKLDHEKKLELYNKLKELYKHVSIKKAFELSNKKPKIIPSKPIFEYPLNNSVKNIQKSNIQNNNKFDNDYERLHELIKKGDYSKVISYYEQL